LPLVDGTKDVSDMLQVILVPQYDSLAFTEL